MVRNILPSYDDNARCLCGGRCFLMVVDDQTLAPETTSVPVMLSVSTPTSVWPWPSEIL
ncbi:hypothetical protein RHECNPAF_430096 [Rhizobium etli CNPAF512]|nr:hypothetical protein RHECNPAF_430096 [Rhizobium etli CNPAF512]